jgi:hypothetical protein
MSTSNGGAIYVNTATTGLYLKSNTFDSCNSTSNGGSIYFDGTSYYSIGNAFIKSVATNYYQSYYAYCREDSLSSFDSVSLTDAKSSNSCHSVSINHLSLVTETDMNISMNKIVSYAGAIYVYNQKYNLMNRMSIINNTSLYLTNYLDTYDGNILLLTHSNIVSNREKQESHGLISTPYNYPTSKTTVEECYIINNIVGTIFFTYQTTPLYSINNHVHKNLCRTIVSGSVSISSFQIIQFATHNFDINMRQLDVWSQIFTAILHQAKNYRVN